MPPTKRGVYHNLKESKYTISNSEIVFFFSSEVYLNKFMDGHENNRKKFKEKWKNVVGENPLNMDTLADILYYRDEVEKRGFFVWLKGFQISWEDLHSYVIRTMIDKESPKWTRIDKPPLLERINRRGSHGKQTTT